MCRTERDGCSFRKTKDGRRDSQDIGRARAAWFDNVKRTRKIVSVDEDRLTLPCDRPQLQDGQNRLHFQHVDVLSALSGRPQSTDCLALARGTPILSRCIGKHNVRRFERTDWDPLIRRVRSLHQIRSARPPEKSTVTQLVREERLQSPEVQTTEVNQLFKSD